MYVNIYIYIERERERHRERESIYLYLYNIYRGCMLEHSCDVHRQTSNKFNAFVNFSVDCLPLTVLKIASSAESATQKATQVHMSGG